jgi:carboxylesterase type B
LKHLFENKKKEFYSLVLDLFTKPQSFSSGPQSLGAFRGADLPFVFNNPPGGEWLSSAFSTEEKKLALLLVTYLAQFVEQGAIGGRYSPLPAWPAYSVARGETALLTERTGTEQTETLPVLSLPYGEIVEFWQTILPK